MRHIVTLVMIVLSLAGNIAYGQMDARSLQFDFYGTVVEIPGEHKGELQLDTLSPASVQTCFEQLNTTDNETVVAGILSYKDQYKPDDWLFYQLIRKTAQMIYPKEADYIKYTLYKWFLLNKTGYNATLGIGGNRLLLYVQCDENIYDIPYYTYNDKQFVCLNYHDYGYIDFERNPLIKIALSSKEDSRSFSYKLTSMPKFRPEEYVKKDIKFDYYNSSYHFEVKVNEQMKKIFANYPTTDYKMYFNTPLSEETYGSLIPQLKNNVKGMSVKNGVDYLMRFTRTAFLYQPDSQSFGKEKRLLPELTLLYEYSDCDDRAALFFYLVKEIYNLPMLVLAYPQHVTVAVKFDKPVGKPIVYNGVRYSVCEPTPQKEDLSIGQIPSPLSKETFEVAFAYNPQ